MADVVPSSSPGLSSNLTTDTPWRGNSSSPSSSSILSADSAESSSAMTAPSLSLTSRYLGNCSTWTACPERENLEQLAVLISVTRSELRKDAGRPQGGQPAADRGHRGA